MSEIEDLQAEYDTVMAKYKRIGLPLIEYATKVRKQIIGLKREAGQLFYVEYMRHHSEYTEECETLEDAKGFAEALSDNSSGYTMRIHGPGVDLGEGEWWDD